MKKYTLQAEKRTVVGRKVKQLRKAGQVPATVYGKKVKSVSLTVPAEAFVHVYQEAGETGLVTLDFQGEKPTAGLPAGRQVLIHTVQKDPVTSQVLHIEFFQVDLKEKVKTRVPLVFVGESAAVANKIGVLLTVMDEVEVEALPTDLPEGIDVNVSGLAQIGQELKVSSLNAPSGVTILADGDLTVVKVGALVSKEAEAQAAADAAAVAAAAPAEGEAAAEGEAKAEKAADAKAGESKSGEAGSGSAREAALKPEAPKAEEKSG